MAKPTLGGAALGFKNLVVKPRRVTKKPRTDIQDRRPLAKDSNVWATLIKKRREFTIAQNVLTRLLELFRNRGSKPEDGHDHEALSAKALVLLFQAERQNRFQAAEKPRSSMLFKIVEDRDIILLQGRKYDP